MGLLAGVKAVNGLLRRLTNLDTLDTVIEIAQEQVEIIRVLQRELAKQKLEYVRNTRDLIGQFLEALEEQIDVSEELRKGFCDLSDEVARLEEHSR